MNTLSFRITEENDLSFELLVDGESLGTLVDSCDKAIPFWLIEDDFPYFPPYGANRDDAKRIVTVCSCGEYGCGHTHCRIQNHADSVVLSDFEFGVTSEGAKKRFQFPRSNYNDVVRQIVQLAREHKLSFSNNTVGRSKET